MLPRASSTDYYYSRQGDVSTVEVGPWGEPLGARTLSVTCEETLSVEDTVWNWDDLSLADTPAPPEQGPTLSLVDSDGNGNAAIAVDLASSQDATLHVSDQSFVPDLMGGYTTAGTEDTLYGSGSSRYEFNLTGLDPGTTYYYYVEFGDQVTSEQSWTTGAESDSFRFVAYGDSQDTTTSLHETHRDIVHLAYSFHPDVVIRIGDQVNNSGSLTEWDYFFAIERPLLSSAIYLTAEGNHEYTGDSDASNYFDRFALPTASPGGEHYYAVQYNNTLFVALSTEITLTGVQESWLQDTLSTADGDPTIDWKVVYFHRPAFSSGWHGSEPGVAAAWHDEFDAYDVDVVFNGHDHDYEHLLADGVHYFVIGGAGSSLRSFSDYPLTQTVYREDNTYHCVVVDADDAQLNLTTYRRDGSVMESVLLVGE